MRPAAFFFDLRVHPDDRVSVRGRHILAAWKAMERWAEERTWAEYGDRDFFPEAFRAGLLSPEMQATGLFSLLHLRSGPSWASIGLFRASRVIRTRVTAIPWAYKLLQPVFSAFEPLLPLPRIPREGGSIGCCHVFNHALDEGATLLTSAFDPDDRFHALFRKRAMNRIEYRLGVKALRPGVPAELARFYPDVRDMN